MSHRRRALLLGGLALILGGLAASSIAGREASLSRRVGELVNVVVAREPIDAGMQIKPQALAVRRVPQRFASDGRIASPDELQGLRASVDIPAGTDLSAAMVGDGRSRPAGPPIRRGERIAHLVALGSPDLVTAGSRVDILVTPEPQADERGQTVLALEDVEVLDAAAFTATEQAPSRGTEAVPGDRVAVSLRVTLRQAVYLAAAQDFARELRLLPRSDGDRARGKVGLRMGSDFR